MRTKCKIITSEKDKCISILEQQLQDAKNKKEKGSLEMKLVEQDEMISESSRIYREEVDRLKIELSVTCTKLQKQINDLQEKLKCEEVNHLEKITDLQTEIKLAEVKNQKEQLAFQREKESLQERICEQENINSQLDKLSTQVTNQVEKIKYERECLQRKLKEQENEFVNNQIQTDKLKSEKEQLQKSFHSYI